MVDCKYGDSYCPCQDGDICHYEGEDPMPYPRRYTETLEAQNKVLWKGLEACEIYLRETGAIGLAVTMKEILDQTRTNESEEA